MQIHLKNLFINVAHTRPYSQEQSQRLSTHSRYALEGVGQENLGKLYWDIHHFLSTEERVQNSRLSSFILYVQPEINISRHIFSISHYIGHWYYLFKIPFNKTGGEVLSSLEKIPNSSLLFRLILILYNYVNIDESCMFQYHLSSL
jgi:hypothetical protein